MLASVLTIGLAACSSAPRDAGFSNVERIVAEQAGHEVSWTTLSGDTAATEVRTLLDHPLTADDAVRVALLSNRSLQATFESLGIARGDLIEASTFANPSLDARVRWSSHAAGTNPEIALLFDVTDLVRRGKRKTVADANLERVMFEVSDAVLRLAAEARGAYFTLQAAEHVQRMRREVFSATEAGAQLAERQRAAGNINALTVSMEQGALQDARLELTRSENETALARIALARVIGLAPTDTAWTAADELPAIPDADPSIEELEGLALDGRFDLRAAHKGIDAARSEMSYRKWFFIPSLALGVDAERDFDHEWAVGPAIQLSLPLFDRGQGGVERSKAMVRQAEYHAAAMENEVRNDVHAAYRRLQAARAAVEIYRDSVVPTREKIVAESQKHYNFMLIGAATLLQAKREEIEAYSGYIEAVRDYWLARSDLERAVAARLGTAEKP
jgi:cobalt-zinc-cadmium efflux system outer membrane protein